MDNLDSFAEKFINATAAKLEDAVNNALANGATAEQLVPVTAEISTMRKQCSEIASNFVNQFVSNDLSVLEINEVVESTPEVVNPEPVVEQHTSTSSRRRR